MKKLFAGVALASVALVGCASNQLNDKQVVMVEGQPQEVQIKALRSFQVEIAPRKAVCELTNTAGEKVQAECLQYRRPFDRNFNTLAVTSKASTMSQASAMYLILNKIVC